LQGDLSGSFKVTLSDQINPCPHNAEIDEAANFFAGNDCRLKFEHFHSLHLLDIERIFLICDLHGHLFSLQTRLV
jgi:hypothetical protein